jgi:CRP-like cAMP-binding protein
MPAQAQARSSIANWLLAALPEIEYERLRPHMVSVSLPQGEIIYHQRERITHAYFPISGSASLLTISEQGSGIEVAIVGSEGMLGLPAAFGINAALFEIIMQVSGDAVRVKASVLRDEFRRHGALQDQLLRYSYALVAQISQTAVCNRFHSLEQRLCRWLLLTADRAESHRFDVTQEFLSYMLGSGRQGVNKATRSLHKKGAIHCGRAKMSVVDQEGLEAASCDCYRAIKVLMPRCSGARPERKKFHVVSPKRQTSIPSYGIVRPRSAWLGFECANDYYLNSPVRVAGKEHWYGKPSLTPSCWPHVDPLDH